MTVDDLVPGRREDDPAGDHAERDQGRRREPLTEGDGHERCDRALGRADRRDDRDLAAAQRDVRHAETADRADARDREPEHVGRVGIPGDTPHRGDRRDHDEADEHDPRERRRSADHARGARRAERRRAPEERRSDAPENRRHARILTALPRCGRSGSARREAGDRRESQAGRHDDRDVGRDHLGEGPRRREADALDRPSVPLRRR